MEIFSILTLAWGSLMSNKGRSFLTMLGIIIGIAAVIIIVSAGSGAQGLIYNQIQSLGSNLVGILPGKSDDNGPPTAALGVVITTLTYEDAKAMIEGPNAVAHLSAITAYARGQGHISYGKESSDIPFNGVMASYPRVIDQKIEAGRFFNQQEEKNLAKVIVLGYTVKQDLFGESDALGKMVKLNNEKFSVIGVFEKKGTVAFQDLDGQVYLPISTAQKILLGSHSVGLVRGRVDNDQYIDQAMEEMRSVLRLRHRIRNPEDDDFTVLSQQKALEAIGGVTDVIKFVLTAVAAISLLVGGIGIMNIMLVVIQERRREIGLRKAIGAKPAHIQRQFLIESLVVTTVGGFMGMLLGFIVITLIAFVIRALGYHWEYTFPFDAFAAATIVAFGIGIVFGYYPARKAARLNPIEALRYE